MKGYGIVSATSVVVGAFEKSSSFATFAAIRHGMHSRTWGKIGTKVFTEDDRAKCVAAVNKKLDKKRASLRKQLAALEALTGEQVVAAAETKAKVDA